MSCSPESSFITAHPTVLAGSGRDTSSSPAKRSIGVIAAKTVSSTNLLNSTENVSVISEQDEGRGPIERAPSLRRAEGEKDEEKSDRDVSEGQTMADESDAEVDTDAATKQQRRTCVYKAAEYVVAVHRQLSRQDTYFLQYHKTKPSLFGLPLLVPWYEGCTNKDLYCAVWIQVARFLSPLPPTPPDQANHATDWWVFGNRIKSREAEW